MALLSDPLRVVHLISADLWAGAEVATWHLLGALARRDDVAVRAVLFNQGELSRRLERAGVPVALIPEATHAFPGLVRRVRQSVAGADLVHAHRYKENLIAALSGRPWVATLHGRPEPRPAAATLVSDLSRSLDRFAVGHFARRAVAVSREVERHLATRMPAARITRAWNGIADPLAGAAPPEWSRRPATVGALGRLYPVKAFELAIDAVAGCEGVSLEIAGDGPERARLARRIDDRGVGDRVHLLGHVDDPRPLLARWRLLLVTSLHEGNPIGVMEALASGTPVLSADLEGVSEVLDDRGGWRVPSRDPADWAREIHAHASGEDGARASVAARARFLEAFTADAAAERIMDVYRDAVAGRGSA